jgi:hypothetical protein
LYLPSGIIVKYCCKDSTVVQESGNPESEVEEYIERLRQEPPVVTWKVRCFHYEQRKGLSALSYPWAFRRFLIMKEKVEDEVPPFVEPPLPWMFTRKVVTHETSGNYTYAR